MRSAHQKRVDEFMQLAGQEVPGQPINDPSEEVRLLRAKLIFEEAMETISKGLGVEIGLPVGTVDRLSEVKPFFLIRNKFDLIETIDGCCDVAVVTTGTLSALGIPDKPFQKEVDNNNLKKFGPGGHRNADGKWIKPPGHKPPDIEGVLRRLNAGEMETTTENRTNKEIATKLASALGIPDGPFQEVFVSRSELEKWLKDPEFNGINITSDGQAFVSWKNKGQEQQDDRNPYLVREKHHQANPDQT